MVPLELGKREPFEHAELRSRRPDSMCTGKPSTLDTASAGLPGPQQVAAVKLLDAFFRRACATRRACAIPSSFNGMSWCPCRPHGVPGRFAVTDGNETGDLFRHGFKLSNGGLGRGHGQTGREGLLGRGAASHGWPRSGPGREALVRREAWRAGCGPPAARRMALGLALVDRQVSGTRTRRPWTPASAATA